MSRSRPTGVTILAVLQLITSILVIIAGLLFVTTTKQLGTGADVSPELAAGPPAGIGWLFLLTGAIGLALAWGLFTLQGWAWLITLIFQGLNIASHLASFGSNAGGAILGIVIAAVIIYYLLTPEVKRAFGK